MSNGNDSTRKTSPNLHSTSHLPSTTYHILPTSDLSRRNFLKAGAFGLAAASLPTATTAFAQSAVQGRRKRGLRIVDIKRTTVEVPFRETSGRNMARELPHWTYSEIFEVKLQSSHVGIGETLLYYTWGVTTDDDVKRAHGKNALDLMWDDSLGAGLQMALFDAVAKSADVPVHRLLRRKVNDKTPLSWWNIDTSAEDMAAECKEALRLGYRSYKTKGRPWYDVWKQAEMVAKAVPEWFKLDIDFNDTLLDAERGIPIIKDLEKHPQIDIFETPIPQSDIPGNKRIREATRVKIAMHYGTPPPIVAISQGVCDGFVVGGGASRVMQSGAVAATGDLPFWLQLVGTGLTAAFSLHFGGVLSHAKWPAVNCHQLYTHSMLAEPIVVKDGHSQVPDAPGLGYELDRDAVARFKVDKPARRPDPPRLIETTWPDGRKLYFGNTGRVNFVLTPARLGKTPYFEKGVDTRLLPNDGSTRWRQLYEKARKGPLMVRE